jgi:phage tail P2-like protein
MMSNVSETILPDSIAIQNDIAAIDIAIKKYLETIPIEKLLVYDIDNITAEALPVLAAQFDVLGYKGMRLAVTGQDKRNLIKSAIELHRYAGTPWAVKEAMKRVGFYDAVITEGVAGPLPIWANFSVTLSNGQQGINDSSIADLRKMIEVYKAQRSNLVDINMILNVQDTVQFDTDMAAAAEDIIVRDNVIFTNKLLYDGQADYDGTYDHSGDSDLVTIEPV